MATVGDLEAPVGDLDATVDRKIGRALDTGVFRSHGFSHAKSGEKSFAKPGGKAGGVPDGKAGGVPDGKSAGGAFTGKKADGEPFGKVISSGFIIPGLWTPEVAREKEFYDSINQSLVHLHVKLPSMKELSISQTWYLLSGKMNLKDLSDRVVYKLNLEVACPMTFAVDDVELSKESVMSDIVKKYVGSDGFVHLFCDITQDPVKHGWITIERKKKRTAKNATAPAKTGPAPTATKTGPMSTAMSELITEMSVPYSKFPCCKTKGNRKISQFVKKRYMQLANDQRSPFVQTKEGPAVRSFGTYGPSGNLEYY